MAGNEVHVLDVRTEDMTGVLSLIQRRARLDRPVDVLIESGMTEATGYRRIREPEDMKLGELRSIGRRFGIPVSVITAGELAVMRWLTENPGPLGPGPSDAQYPPRDSNPEPTDLESRRLRQTVPLRRAA